MPSEFIYFSSLPTELRLQIWRIAQFPRIIRIHICVDARAPERPWDAITNYHAWASRRSRPFNVKCLTPPPAILAINRESRQECQGLYKLVSDDSGRGFYYAQGTDTLWIEHQEYTDDWAMLLERTSARSRNSARYPPRKISGRVAIRDDGFHHTLQMPNFAALVRDSVVADLLLISEGREGTALVWPIVPGIQRCSLNYPSCYEHEVLVQQFERLKAEGNLGDTPLKIRSVSNQYWKEEILSRY